MRGVINGTLDTNNALSCILNLKKLIAHPNMIFPENNDNNDEEDELFTDTWGQANKLFPKGFDANSEDYQPQYSGKMTILNLLLKQIKEEGDRVVIVSNYTSVSIDLLLYM